MENIDLTLAFTILTALAAIITPLFVAKINNNHQLRLRKLDYEQTFYERDIIEKKKLFYDFLSAVGAVSKVMENSNLIVYGKLFPIVITRVNDNLKKELLELDNIIRTFDINMTSEKLRVIIPMIKEEIDSITK